LAEKSADPAFLAAALRQSRQQLEFALEAGRLGSWELDVATNRLVSSEYCRTIFGLTGDDPFERYEDIVARVHPDDRKKREDAVASAIKAHTDIEVEHRILWRDGTVTWVLTRGRAVYEGRRAVRVAGVSLDITAQKHAEAHQRLLFDELNHRVKNTLATVQSIAMQAHRDATLSAPDGEAFVQRIHALSRAHDLLTEGAWLGASLGEVVERTMAVADAKAQRVAMAGPAVRLNPNAAVTLNMAFHELATNAIKYGALSTSDGGVEVTWTVEDDGVVIEWREFAGPVVSPPSRRGFGSRLIEQALPREMSGEARLVFDAAGLRCHMSFPFSAKLSLAT